MSGGFFRGTSADQDTRFSNKAAKLLKSQKFASELDHLVDISKVKMDVIRPWIANRVTELLGFEDEVLINFIYGLLDGKDVDGKQIQIQLTGFMEKNTGKFMKELWNLLLSAQKNISGVPQQFLDAKEEETKQKKAEADRISHEIKKKKDREEAESEKERWKKLDADNGILETVGATANDISKKSSPKALERDLVGRQREKNRASESPPDGHSPSSHRSTPVRRSRSKSLRDSRSRSRYLPFSGSGERPQSRSMSRSPPPRRRSISIGRRSRSPLYPPRRRRSPRYLRSPPRRRSPRPRRRSLSPPRRRSPSPRRYRSPSPMRRRSPSPIRRRSPSPPFRRRSPSPPLRRRSPTPIRRRSPFRRSPSPIRRRSPPSQSPRHRRRSPVRSPRRRPMDSRLTPRSRNRSSSPYRNRRSLSRERLNRMNGGESRRYRDEYAARRTHMRRSPDQSSPSTEEVDEQTRGMRKVPESYSRPPQTSLRSPQRDDRTQSDTSYKIPALSSPPEQSPGQSESPEQRTHLDKGRRKSSPYDSPKRSIRERANSHVSPDMSNEEDDINYSRELHSHGADPSRKRNIHSLTVSARNEHPRRALAKSESSPVNVADQRSSEHQGQSDNFEPRKKEHRSLGSVKSDGRANLPERHTQPSFHASEEIEYGPGRLDSLSLDNLRNKQSSAKRHVRDTSSPDERDNAERLSMKKSYSRESYGEDENLILQETNVNKISSPFNAETAKRPMKRLDQNDQCETYNSDEEYEKKRSEKRKQKREESKEASLQNDTGSASPIDERKEAKRRKKEERKLRKEERRRRREERHRRKEERHASKRKAKSVATVMPPSESERYRGRADESDGGVDIRRQTNPSDSEEESEQKRLEIELREKALESLRAKKAISH
ncbi:serine/arginine repetitive matrix protein 1 isoform X1 [Amborella trichopoda]|uniref:serine/arginine repetitive matrix protein 1 isoform X1 n=1 Tax=Amborella trichopoda TaxID=13333 RepID=UPI0009BD2E81|nr:serine/arginine repetitive matrix protein 1 isoform X1 [Amborella trichopoda]XP_020523996.1 serine/arginine repetitive matrix protein 1 isoform X1 [Amborella trichopoda]XP_020523997.1 serine/arginine repetitive matrix protein 1 isoform X1 [Amborella trichopoda]XP_020523998.1 serine/arginine repetitive matrix protein 1 isoform X1 [Amborella trichopoda]|eukprot:XP_020523995.1 serine/arginine repetitive matrix protein 1 isoform X1 [Amborella trichopoda]